MKYNFELKDGNTVITYKDDYDYKDINLMLYQWLEGNYSCDCNRKMFMYDY